MRPDVHPITSPCAYDYEAQQWVYGPAAVALIALQDAEEQLALEDPAYRAYVTRWEHPR